MVAPSVWIYSRRACISLFVVLLSVGLAWTKPKKTSADPSESLVAIGDVHGDFDDFVAILQHIGLIDKQNHWTGGKTTFVQTGDLLDRGPKPREVMDLMMALEKEATKAGGRVVGLLGNHEMMNIMGDLRYVTPTNFASFADSKSEERQKIRLSAICEMARQSRASAGRASPANGSDGSGVDGTASSGFRRTAGSFQSAGDLRQVAARARGPGRRLAR